MLGKKQTEGQEGARECTARFKSKYIEKLSIGVE